MNETTTARRQTESGISDLAAYCLFCQTQKAGEVAMILEKRGIYRAFSPSIIKRQRIQGENHDMVYDLLPGYVFVYSTERINTTRDFRGITGIIRRLGEPQNGFLLENTDRDFALELYRKKGVVSEITVFKEGDQVCIEDPLFKGCNGKITRMDYKKQRARVEFEFAGEQCSTWVACKFMEKQDRLF